MCQREIDKKNQWDHIFLGNYITWQNLVIIIIEEKRETKFWGDSCKFKVSSRYALHRDYFVQFGDVILNITCIQFYSRASCISDAAYNECNVSATFPRYHVWIIIVFGNVIFRCTILLQSRFVRFRVIQFAKSYDRKRVFIIVTSTMAVTISKRAFLRAIHCKTELYSLAPYNWWCNLTVVTMSTNNNGYFHSVARAGRLTIKRENRYQRLQHLRSLPSTFHFGTFLLHGLCFICILLLLCVQ